MQQSDWLSQKEFSLNESNAFWTKEAEKLDWITSWKTLQSGSFNTGDIKWFEEGELNVCYNCVDRHLDKYADKTALIWEGDSPDDYKAISFDTLHKQVMRFANVLKK